MKRAVFLLVDRENIIYWNSTAEQEGEFSFWMCRWVLNRTNRTEPKARHGTDEA